MNVFVLLQENSLFNPLRERYVCWDARGNNDICQRVAFAHDHRVVQLVRAGKRNTVADAVQLHCFLHFFLIFGRNDDPGLFTGLQNCIGITALRAL